MLRENKIELDISVIIINWNTKELLLNCVRSLINNPSCLQTEIIVVDNASKDGSPEALLEQFPQVKLVRNKTNVGFAKAINIGISESKGRYVCLINSDVVVRDGCLDSMCAYIGQHPSIGILGPKLLWPDLTLQLSCRRFPSLWNNFWPAIGLHILFPRSRIFAGEHMSYFAHDEIRQVDALVGAFLLVRKEAIDQVGLLDDSFFFYCEEIDWCKRFRQANWQIVFFPQAEAIHYGQGSSSKEPSRYAKEFVLSNYKYWKKHHGRLKQFIFTVFVLFRRIIRLIYGTILYAIKPSKRESIGLRLRTNLEIVTMLFKLPRHS